LELIQVLWYSLFAVSGLALIFYFYKHRKAWGRSAKFLILYLLKTTVLYIIFVEYSVSLFMFISEILGYLPYSDRPGPGWHLDPHFPTWGEFQNLFTGVYGWILFGSTYFALPGILLGVITQGLKLLPIPRWIVIPSLAVFYGYFSLITMAGVGWFIAMSQWSFLIAGVAGIAFGCWMGIKTKKFDAS